MKKFLYLMILPLVFVACGDDNNDPPIVGGIRPGTVNTNANPAYPEGARRLEIPRLKVDGRFLVKKCQKYDGQSEQFVNFCIEWDDAKKAQRWTAFEWDVTNIGGYISRTNDYSEDTEIPQQYRSTQYMHTSNGYDRGHMLASADRQRSTAACSQTYLLSNMHPQFHRFNGYEEKNGKKTYYVWINLEDRVRKFYSSWNQANNGKDTIFAVKGGTIDRADQILEVTQKGLIVPKYFYMAFLYKQYIKADDKFIYKAIAFWVEHTNGLDTTSGNDLKKYCISIDELEEKTGIDFFCNLEDGIENTVERTCSPIAWGFN